MNYEEIFSKYEEKKISGRYIHNENIEPLLYQDTRQGKAEIIGKSVLGKSIYSYKIGTGTTKILAWSQMHGNESTTTKALFDLFNFFDGQSKDASSILKHFTFCFIPILNPDGAKSYTRVNANGIDLNRDAQDLSQPESKVLRQIYEEFQPDYCYNLHDQRTIFGVGDNSKPATVSFLAPSYNEACDWNDTRIKAISVIVGMNKVLQEFIPDQIGRFDDAFNLNCVGDTFQFLGTPTILFEAGHYQNDYQREKTRKYIFFALLSGFNTIYENVIVDNDFNFYMNIPQNKSTFFDFVYKNVKINYDSSEKIINFAAQYNEELIDNTIFFNAFIVKIGDLNNNHGHVEMNFEGKLFSDSVENIPKLNQKADFCLDKSIKIVNGAIKL